MPKIGDRVEVGPRGWEYDSNHEEVIFDEFRTGTVTEVKSNGCVIAFPDGDIFVETGVFWPEGARSELWAALTEHFPAATKSVRFPLGTLQGQALVGESAVNVVYELGMWHATAVADGRSYEVGVAEDLEYVFKCAKGVLALQRDRMRRAIEDLEKLLCE